MGSSFLNIGITLAIFNSSGKMPVFNTWLISKVSGLIIAGSIILINFQYLGSTVQSNGECGREVTKRVQAGWNSWRRMSGVICDRRVPARVKGKVYRVAVRPAMLYGLETVALTKRQEVEMEVAELKMLRFSLGVTRMDKIRNEYIRLTAQVGRVGEKTREVVWTCTEER